MMEETFWDRGVRAMRPYIWRLCIVAGPITAMSYGGALWYFFENWPLWVSGYVFLCNIVAVVGALMGHGVLKPPAPEETVFGRLLLAIAPVTWFVILSAVPVVLISFGMAAAHMVKTFPWWVSVLSLFNFMVVVLGLSTFADWQQETRSQKPQS